jgi:proteic killer suppression protein
MIRSFGGHEAEKVWNGQFSTKVPHDIQRASRRKLRMINNAQSLTDLSIPPGNALEPLKGDRAGQYSIRINDQWRVCFLWAEGNAYEVEIVDYH